MTLVASEVDRSRTKDACVERAYGLWSLIPVSSKGQGQRDYVPLGDRWSKGDPRLRNEEPRRPLFTLVPEQLSALVDQVPRQRAATSRDLIEAIQQEQEARERQAAQREINRLRERISLLEREVSLLQKDEPSRDFGALTVVHGLAVPEALPGLLAALKESRYLLELDDNWDENGAVGFTEQTWKRTAETLVRLSTGLMHDCGLFAKSAEILPGSDGGLDIDMRLERKELLISVSADPGKQARFYGDNGHGDDQVKATFDAPAIPEWVLVWLAE